MEGSVGPMHKWYDSRLFDAMGYEDIAAKLASKDGADQPIDIRTGAELMEAGFDVRLIGDAEEELVGQGAAEAPRISAVAAAPAGAVRSAAADM